ncbi:YdeI/OmpD-associated family protein [Granulicella sp. S190]|uniref:YdeI/OmpD-associated family protein n=1 Tax=Granulicella sp. S190 TaxID=1747226 RepID=UPI0020B109D0|nr:YdeI/OmpD-associated family protein [Granulicella sp. S190]
MPLAELGEDLGAVEVAAGFAGREEDARVGGRSDGISVDFSGGDCMVLSAIRRFRAVLETAGNGLGWVIVWLPFDVEKAWKKMVRLRVKVEMGGEIFRTSLFGDAVRGGYYVLVNKKMQLAAGAKVGAMVDVAIEPDLEEREAELTREFAAILKREKRLARWYGEQSESMQREVGKWLGAVKSVEARQRRAEQMAERMLLAMEGEKVLPPVVEAAFRGRPAARRGWELLTVTQRRTSLLAVFYYQSPEAREKRVRKLVEDCVNAAERERASRR